jgi:hypothetical protein
MNYSRSQPIHILKIEPKANMMGMICWFAWQWMKRKPLVIIVPLDA